MRNATLLKRVLWWKPRQNVSCNVEYISWDVDDHNNLKYTYGVSQKTMGLLHGPDEIHGMNGDLFMEIVEASHDKQLSVKWWRNGEAFMQGDGLFLIWLKRKGLTIPL